MKKLACKSYPLTNSLTEKSLPIRSIPFLLLVILFAISIVSRLSNNVTLISLFAISREYVTDPLSSLNAVLKPYRLNASFTILALKDEMLHIAKILKALTLKEYY